MVGLKACKNCKYIVKEGKKCPICNSDELTERFSGIVIIIDPERSKVAKFLGINTPGEFALSIK